MAAAAAAFNLTVEAFTELFNAKIGLTTTEDLDSEEVFKFGDFLKKFEDRPIGQVRKAYGALRGGKKEKEEATSITDERTAQLKALGFKVKLEEAPVSLLLPLYKPDLPSDPVTQALKKRFTDKPVIAFNDDGTVAVTETLQYVSDLEQSFPARETIMVGGQLAKLWPVGAKPNTLVEEDPLFPGQPLRNGYSIVNNRNWTDIPHVVRQLCRVIVSRGDIDAGNKEAVLRLLERAQSQQKLAETYPEAMLEFRELKQRDELPKLKVVLGAGSKPNNPFGSKRQY